MLTIKTLTIENFRGIRLPLTVNFTKNGKPTSAIVYGRNGTGKSSIVDAWEWLLTCKIDALRKEGVSEKDFPHKSCEGENSYVAVEFNHTEIKYAKSRFNKNKITSPIQEGNFSQFKEVCYHPNHLRYADLQAFVFKTKTDKYKYIARYFGLENFTQNQEGIQYALNKIGIIQQGLKTEVSKNVALLKDLTSLEEFSVSEIISFVNSIGKKYSIPAINDFAEVESVLKKLEQIVEKNPITKELLAWRSFKGKLYNFFPINISQIECNKLKEGFQDLMKDAENIKLLFLSNLYESTLQVIPILETPNKCPVCNKLFEGNLFNHINNQHNFLKLLNTKKREFDNLKASIRSQFQSLEHKLRDIGREHNDIILTTFSEFFDKVKTIENCLPSIHDILKGELKDIKILDICSENGFDTIMSCKAEENTIKTEVNERILFLEADETSKTLAKDYRELSELRKAFVEYRVNEEKIAFLERTNTHLNNLFVELTYYIQNQIQTIFNSISSDVVDYFNVLEDNNQYIKNPELKLLTGKDKAIELEIEFVNEKIIPAFKFLSESQINSFGLAIFLASVKHFNTSFKFFILDDVINSFDAYKRPRVAKLFSSKLTEFQILLLTHDQVFFDSIQRDFPEWQRYKFTGWDYLTGPKMALSRSNLEEINKQIEEDNPTFAGSLLGRYLEWVLGLLNQRMETPITYRVENNYTLIEFYNPLVKRFKEKLKKSNKVHTLINLFDDFDSSTIFRNYCAHYKNESTPFTASEIDLIAKKWSSIEESLYCKKCKSYVQYRSVSNNTYIKCDCSDLDLFHEAYFN